MSEFLTNPYNLELDDLIKVQVAARNSIDLGVYSPSNTFGATVRTVPIKMPDPFRGEITSTNRV